jgi:hypothetical protein
MHAISHHAGLVGMILLLTICLGCGRGAADQATEAADPTATAGTADDHSSWWRTEHGVPEEVCGICNAKLAAEFQKKGDWCAAHDRPDSQCFVCHPELEAQFAARYEAKYGKKPPKPEG